MLSLTEANNARFSKEPCLINIPKQISFSAVAEAKMSIRLDNFTLKLSKLQLQVPMSAESCSAMQGSRWLEKARLQPGSILILSISGKLP